MPNIPVIHIFKKVQLCFVKGRQQTSMSQWHSIWAQSTPWPQFSFSLLCCLSPWLLFLLSSTAPLDSTSTTASKHSCKQKEKHYLRERAKDLETMPPTSHPMMSNDISTGAPRDQCLPRFYDQYWSTLGQGSGAWFNNWLLNKPLKFITFLSRLQFTSWATQGSGHEYSSLLLFSPTTTL